MFGKKKKEPSASYATQGRMQVIPPIFYAGKNPSIYERNGQHKQNSGLSAYTRTQMNGRSSPRRSVSQWTQKKKIVVGVLAGLVLLLLVIGYVLFDNKKKSSLNEFALSDTPIDTLPTDEVPAEEDPLVSADDSVAEVTESVETSTIVSSSDETEEETDETFFPGEEEQTTLLFPPLLFLSGIDLDNDGLTDQEEVFFESDPAVWDSDEDGYNDGEEIANLYNPAVASQKLIDSGVVQEYIQASWQYRLYYPLAWEVANVLPTGDQVLFSIITGEYISVQAVAKQNQESFLAWFSREAKGQQYSDYTESLNQFQVPVFLRRDGLVAMVERDDVVFVLMYNYNNERRVRYPRVMELAVQSFRPRRSIQVVPEQVVLPVETVTNTSGTIPDALDAAIIDELDVENLGDNTDELIAP